MIKIIEIYDERFQSCVDRFIKSFSIGHRQFKRSLSSIDQGLFTKTLKRL